MEARVISMKPGTIGTDAPVVRVIKDLDGQERLPGMGPEREPEQIPMFDQDS